MSIQELQKEMFGPAFSEAALREACEKYPYFSPLHFFRLKTTPADSPEFDAIAGLTSLHFENTYLLNLQLNKKNTENIFSTKKPDSPISTTTTVANSGGNGTSDSGRSQPAADELLFEPLHTSDYFASQGIKLNQEQTDDKLGKQLKSFTEWLKTMKKPNGYRLQETKVIDKTVEKLAEKSNIETEVLTETMAEVFARQGKLDKAFEIYNKLSLQNPAKSAYFASKIEQLKEK